MGLDESEAHVFKIVLGLVAGQCKPVLQLPSHLRDMNINYGRRGEQNHPERYKGVLPLQPRLGGGLCRPQGPKCPVEQEKQT